MRGFDLIIAAVAAGLLAGPAMAEGTGQGARQGLVAWSSDALGIAAKVPQGWTSDEMPGGGILFSAPDIDPHKTAHVALRAHADQGSDLAAAHDQLLHTILLDGDTVLSDDVTDDGFAIRSKDSFGKVTLRKTERLDCAGGAVLASVQTDYPADLAEGMAPLLADVPGTLGCK
ncbi:hypothetical protein [Thioclava sp.]|uniref:hypothetical protein n=1 Tax=Thioclava sp. TaxID=1933450 RepID=UPI0032428C9E